MFNAWIALLYKDFKQSQQHRQARPCLETLEGRLAPAIIPGVVEWQITPMQPQTWNNRDTWAQRRVPGVNETALFTSVDATPSLSADATVARLTARSWLGAQGKTTLDLNTKTLTATTQTQVFSAAGVRRGPAAGLSPPSAMPGNAGDASLILKSTGGAGTFRTGQLIIGQGQARSVRVGTRNNASMTVGKDVTADVTGLVAVGGLNTTTLNVNEGTLKAANFFAGGANTTVTWDKATVAVTGNIKIGAKLQGMPGTAALTVKGGTVTTAALEVGGTDAGATGSVTLQDGAKVTTTGNITVGLSRLTTGLLNIQSGEATAGDRLFNRERSRVIVGGAGKLTLTNGGRNEGTIQLSVNGRLITQAGGLINAGKVYQGTPAAGVGFNFGMEGDFTQEATGHLVINIGGNVAGVTHDRFTVETLAGGAGGNAVLGGTLDATVNYAPAPWRIGGPAGDFFTVLSARTNLSGQFDALNLPDPSTLGLPTLPPGRTYAWRVVYDTADAPDAALAAQFPGISQPWAGNGTDNVVLLLTESALPDVVATSARPGGAGTLLVNYRVDGQTIVAPFSVSVFASADGVRPDNPSAPLATLVVPGAGVGGHTAALNLAGQAIPPGTSLIAVVDAGGAVAESAEHNNTIALGQLIAPGVSAFEAEGAIQYSLTLASPSSKPVTVFYQTAAAPGGNPATAGADYTPASGSVTFAPGETEKVISIPVADDGAAEPDETFLLQFSSPDGAYFLDGSGAVSQAKAATLTLRDSTGSVSGAAWGDTNRNGVRDAGEVGLAGVPVFLYDESGTVVATTTTDSAGNYVFANVPQGIYSVGFTVPAGKAATLQDQGAEDSLDSDVDPATAASVPFVVEAGGAVAHLGAGFALNSPPTAGPGGATTTSGTPVLINPRAFAGDPDGDALTLFLASLPQHGTVEFDDNGTPADPSDDVFVYTPDAGFAGVDSFDYRLSDGFGGVVTATLTVTVVPGQP